MRCLTLQTERRTQLVDITGQVQDAVADGHDDRRRGERRADVGRRVLLPRLDVLPPPVVADEALEGALEIARDGRVGVLLDDDAGRRVRDVDERRGGARRPSQRGPDLARDVDHLGLALGPHLEVPRHGGLSYAANDDCLCR